MDSFGAIKLEVLAARPRISGSRIGRIVEIAAGGSPMVDFPGNPLGARPARWVGSLTRAALAVACAESRAALLVFEDNDASRPIIVDTIVGAADDEVAPQGIKAVEPQVGVTSVNPSTALPLQAGNVQLALVTGIEDGKLLVETADQPGRVLRADATLPLRNLKDPVLLLHIGDTPVVIGQLLPAPLLEGEGDPHAELVIRGENVRIEASSLLRFQAGNCSFELDARGRAVLVGDQIVSRARTSNKLQGGNVQIN